MPLSPGSTFERYRIDVLVGRGGMGEVYRALDTRLNRPVALKVLRTDEEAAAAVADAGGVARLLREAKVLDFGLAKAVHGSDEILSYVTQMGQALGTPRYVSPEQLEGQPADASADPFGFGVTAYEVLSGRLPRWSARRNDRDRSAHRRALHDPAAGARLDGEAVSASDEQPVAKTLEKSSTLPLAVGGSVAPPATALAIAAGAIAAWLLR